MSKTIAITQGKQVLVDDDIFEQYGSIPFHASRIKDRFYARTSRKILSHSERTYLHHLVLGPVTDKKWMICFKDGNTLNCQRDNLYYLRRSDNTQKSSKLQTKREKSSKYLGVSFVPAFYTARIKFEKKTINIGTFDTEIDAAQAYNNYAKRLFGDKAKINSIE